MNICTSSGQNFGNLELSLITINTINIFISFLSQIICTIQFQEGLLTNAKVYIHVTVWIKVVTQTAMYSQYYIQIYMIYKGTKTCSVPMVCLLHDIRGLYLVVL